MTIDPSTATAGAAVEMPSIAAELVIVLSPDPHAASDTQEPENENRRAGSKWARFGTHVRGKSS